MANPEPKFTPPRWYQWALWPLLAVILVGLICLGIALFHVVHGLFTPGLAPTPKPILFTGVACVGGGGVVARTLQMIVAVQQDRWSKAHGGADPYRRYDDVNAQVSSDDAAVESLGLRFSDPKDDQPS